MSTPNPSHSCDRLPGGRRSPLSPLIALSLLSLLLLGCPDETAAPADSPDSASSAPDASNASDSLAPTDAAESDAARADTAPEDTAPEDTAPEDTAVTPDLGPPDAGAAIDSTTPDAPVQDTGPLTDTSPPSDTAAATDATTGDVPPAPPESACDDEQDNDNNGETDCEDPACELTSACSPTCTPVGTLTCGATLSAATTAPGSTTALSSWACADGFFTGPERAWSLSVNTATTVVISLTQESDETSLMLVEGLQGQCFPQQCVAFGASDLLFSAQPGVDYFVVVDGAEGSAGSFDLEVACESCSPDCAQKVCGDDGCGGSCGACAPGSQCQPDGGACLASAAGDTCQDATPIAGLPVVVTASTVSAFDDLNALGFGCQDTSIGGGPDVVYAYTAASNEVVDITLTELGFDASLYVLTDCANPSSACVDGSDFVTDESVSIPMNAGQTYFIVVDGADDLESGAFTLSLTGTGICVPVCAGACGGDDGCGGTCPCGQGEQCQSALTIDPQSLPVTLTGNTAAAQDDYFVPWGACPGAPGYYTFGKGSRDLVYQITPPTTQAYTLALLPGLTDFDATLYVVSQCDNVADSCLGGDDIQGALGGELVHVTLQGGQPYFVVIDGYGSKDAGNYALSVSQCVPTCDGKTCGDDGCGGSCGACQPGSFCGGGVCSVLPTNTGCDNAATISGPGFYTVGTTVDLQSAFDLPKTACGGALTYNTGKYNGDLAWQLTPTTDAVYTFRVDVLGAEWEPTLAVVSDCATPAETCLVGSFAGVDKPLALTAGQTYTVIVDGDFPGDDEGVFGLSVCGACAANETCTAGECVAPTNACGGVSTQGCCTGAVLSYCAAGSLETYDCGIGGCGWDTDSAFYDCNFEGQDPSGTWPLTCPN